MLSLGTKRSCISLLVASSTNTSKVQGSARICNGLDLEGEFETRIGSDVGTARKLLDRIARS